jgi:hypothetical protein
VDRAEASRIAHGELRLWNPLSERALDEAIELLEPAPGAGVLDVACGRAEVLRRVAERWEVRGSGYDSDPALIESGPPGLDLQVREHTAPRRPGAAGRGLLAPTSCVNARALQGSE